MTNILTLAPWVLFIKCRVGFILSHILELNCVSLFCAAIHWDETYDGYESYLLYVFYIGAFLIFIDNLRQTIFNMVYVNYFDVTHNRFNQEIVVFFLTFPPNFTLNF